MALTGSGGISLDSQTVSELKIPFQPSDKTIRGIAGIRKVNFAYNNTLRLPCLNVDSLNFHINDYDILTSVYGEHIDGIIGYSFFNRYIVKINYDSSLIYVYSKGSIKYPKGGYLLKPLLVNLLIQTARIADGEERTARFYFDTGAGLCLLLSADFVEDSSLFSPKRKKVLTQVEGLGGNLTLDTRPGAVHGGEDGVDAGCGEGLELGHGGLFLKGLDQGRTSEDGLANLIQPGLEGLRRALANGLVRWFRCRLDSIEQ